MTSLDDDLLPAVLELLDELGKNMTVKIKQDGDYDVLEGEVVRPDDLEYTVKGLPPGEYRDYFGPNSLIKSTDLQTGFAGQDLAFEPVNEMAVAFDGKEFSVNVVQPIYSGESVCLWLLNLTKGSR